MKKKQYVFLALLMVCTLFVGCSKKPAPTEAPSNVQEKKESSEAKETLTDDGDLIVYNSTKEEIMAIMLENFEKSTNVHGETILLSAGEAVGRITAEEKNPQASLWYGGGIDSYIAAKEAGLLEAFVPENADLIDAKFKDPDGYFYGTNVTYLVICYNQALLAEKGVEAPKSWNDLLKKDFEGQITIANPGSSGTAYTFLSTICQILGEEEGLQYMKELDKNIKSYEKSGSAPARLVAQGEAMVCVTYYHDVAAYQEQGFTDLVGVMPEEGTGYEIACTALVKGGPAQEAGKKFIEYALTAESQEIGDVTGYYTAHTNPNAKISDQIKALGEIKTIDYDFIWAGTNKARLIEEWSKLVGQ